MPSRLASAGGGPGGPGLSSSASVASVAATQAAGGERALVLGDWTAAAELGLAALAGGGGGAAAQRGSCVAIQALFELGRFDEAHPALVSGFGGPMRVPPDALMLWAALGLDAGSASLVAAELAAYLDAAAVPGGRGPPPRRGEHGGGGQPPQPPSQAPPLLAAPSAAGPVLTRDQYETACRLLLIEALCREAGRPGDAVAWADGGGLAPLTAERAAALRGEVAGAAAAAAVAAATAPAPAAAAPPKVPHTPFATLAPPSPPQPAAAAVASAGPAGLGGGPTVALGAGGLGAVARSASFLAATPERLAELWRSPSSNGVGENGAPPAPPPPPFPPKPHLASSLGLPAAAAAAAAAGVLAYAAFAERRALGRALRAAAARLGVADAARAAVAVAR